MPTENQINNQERLDMQDYAFRQSMLERQSQDPEAKQWVELDQQAETLQSKVERDENRLEKRPQSVIDYHQQLQDARQARSDFQTDSPRPGFFSGAQKQWDADYTQLDRNVGSAKQDLSIAAKKASPEELEALRVKIAERRDELIETITKRQGISMLPSEVASQSQGQNQDQTLTQTSGRVSGQENLSDKIATRRGMAEEQSQQDVGAGGERAGRRLQPNWAAYAETAEDIQFTRQLEEDQRTLHQRFHRPATHEEVVAYQEARKAQEQQETSTYAQRTERREQEGQAQVRSEGQGRAREGNVQQRDDFGMSM